jgi:phosphoglycerate dehydrogenase-like enzyme
MGFVVGLSPGFLREDRVPAFPDFDLSPLERDPGIALRRLPPRGGRIEAEDTAGLDALILLGEGFTAESIAPDGRLKLVARFGVGFDRVDVAACTAAGIAVSITPDAVRRPVAVAIIALMLALACRLPEKDELARLGATGFARRCEAMGIGLEGRVLGSLGLGNIASEMFRLAEPFGMRFIAHDPYADPERAAALGVALVDLDALFAHSDVLALNAPLTPATRGIVSAARIARMKPSAFLINTARGGLLDQAALAAALRERRIAGAGLDVFEPEPPSPDDPIFAAPNLIAAPHGLAWTDQGFAAIGAACILAVQAVREGRAPAHLADPKVLERPPRFSR